MELKIISWNIWVEGNFEQTAKFLKSANADIIGLQEVRDDIPNKNIIEFLENLGYDYVFEAAQMLDGTKFGVALFSKFPILNKQILKLSNEQPRVAVGGKIIINNTTLHVFATHLSHTHQQPSNVQEQQVESLIKVLPKEHTIIMGDFNATPESQTIKNLEKYFTNADKELQPTWSTCKNDCPTCQIEKLTVKLDYIFTSKNIKATLFKVEESKASDHLPISIIINI